MNPCWYNKCLAELISSKKRTFPPSPGLTGTKSQQILSVGGASDTMTSTQVKWFLLGESTWFAGTTVNGEDDNVN